MYMQNVGSAFWQVLLVVLHVVTEDGGQLKWYCMTKYRRIRFSGYSRCKQDDATCDE